MNNILHNSKRRRIIVSDKMQKMYSYTLSKPTGKDFDPDFNPDLTPKQMLSMGVFGGKYMTDCTKEFPKTWFVHAKLSSSKKNVKLNFFNVDASQSLTEWNKKGWINSQDPRGWFQWYCRYYMGRRGTDDARQIKRWRAMRRHIAQIRQKCLVGDFSCNRRQRQALLHWAYDSRKF